MTAITEQLTAVELTRLETLEDTIHGGMDTFVRVGAALMEIRDKRLYRALYRTFGAYCRDRWGFTDRRARMLIDASGAMSVLETDAESGTAVPLLPTSERQVRPLTGLPPEQQREIWTQAVDSAPDGKVTAAHVADVARNIRPARPVPPPAAARTVYDPPAEVQPEPPADVTPAAPAPAAAPDIYAPGYKPTASELFDDYERAEIAANAPAALDDLPLVDEIAVPGLTAAARADRRRTYAWLRTIYAEARDGLRMYEEATGDFASRGPLLRLLEPMVATLDRHIAAYEHGGERPVQLDKGDE